VRGRGKVYTAFSRRERVYTHAGGGTVYTHAGGRRVYTPAGGGRVYTHAAAEGLYALTGGESLYLRAGNVHIHTDGETLYTYRGMGNPRRASGHLAVAPGRVRCVNIWVTEKLFALWADVGHERRVAPFHLVFIQCLSTRELSITDVTLQ